MRLFWISLCAVVLSFTGGAPSYAGLDLENQKEIHIENLDLDLDGRISREEVAEYMFFYFDRDGNESLSREEYSREREITVYPYEGDSITMIDIDKDGVDDGRDFTTESFLDLVMVGDYETEDDKIMIEADEVTDMGYLKIDTDRSKYVELDEWQKVYKKHAIKKGNLAPKAANNDIYGN